MNESEIDKKKIESLLPHREPMLLIDKLVKIVPLKSATAIMYVKKNGFYVQGHFPGHPVMPGVLQLEAMAQVAGILMLKKAGNAGKIAYFMAADKVKWRKPVQPGDVLQIDIELIKAGTKIGKAKAKCTVGQQMVSEAEITFALVDQN